MLNLLRKIIKTGNVTQSYETIPVPPRFRGEVTWEESKCTSCQGCNAVCPTEAIKFNAGKLVIDNKKCIFCGRCSDFCEQKALAHSNKYLLAELKGQLSDRVKSMLGRSLQIRHVDAGSCNACDWEMAALSNPVYDLQQYGIDFVASPRHADMLMVTGSVTRNLVEALKMTYDAVPAPKLVMAVGACAAGGQVFGDSYAVCGPVNKIVPVDIYVPGCPPRPSALIYGLLLALDRLGGTHNGEHF